VLRRVCPVCLRWERKLKNAGFSSSFLVCGREKVTCATETPELKELSRRGRRWRGRLGEDGDGGNGRAPPAARAPAECLGWGPSDPSPMACQPEQPRQGQPRRAARGSAPSPRRCSRGKSPLSGAGTAVPCPLPGVTLRGSARRQFQSTEMTEI